MGLKHLKLPSAEIKFTGGKFSVRGLSLDDIGYLVSHNKEKLSSLFDKFQEQQGDLDSTDSVTQFIGPLVETAPVLVAQVIACGAGDAEDWEVARSLPVPVQVEALEHIITLTFSAEGGPKKVMEAVIRMAQGTTALLDSLGQTSLKA